MSEQDPIVFEDATVTGIARRPFLTRMSAFVAWFTVAICFMLSGHPRYAGGLYFVSVAIGLAYFLPIVARQIALGPEWAAADRRRRAEASRLVVRGTLRVSGEELTIDGERIARRAHIVRGLVGASETETGVLVLHRKRRPGSRWLGVVTIELPDETTARELSRALETDLSSNVLHSSVKSPLRLAAAIYMALLIPSDALALSLGANHTWLYLLPILLFVSLPFVGIACLIPARLRIGTDGVEWRWAWRRRLIPYRTVADLVVAPSAVTFELRDGARVTWGWLDGPLVVARLREALDAYRANGAPDAGAWLARKERPREEWVRELRSIGNGHGRDYRTYPPSREVLWRFVEDPSADAQLRAASAVALGGTLDDLGRARLRVVAKTTVLPELRAVLEHEAEADTGAAEEALEAVERLHVGA